MEILVLTGRPRKNDNLNMLTDKFIQEAGEAGHRFFRFEAAQSNVNPCITCNSWGMDGPCVFRDDFETARENHFHPYGCASNSHELL